MKYDEQVDELFRNGFNPDFSEEIPTDFLSDLNQRLDDLEQSKRKKRTPVYWWVAGVFSMIGLMLFAYSFNQSQNKHLISEEKTNSGLSAKKFFIQQTKSTKYQELMQSEKGSLIVGNQQNKFITREKLTQKNEFVNSNETNNTESYSKGNLGENNPSRINLKTEIFAKNEFENKQVNTPTFPLLEVQKDKNEIMTHSTNLVSETLSSGLNPTEDTNSRNFSNETKSVENQVYTINPTIKDSVKKVKTSIRYSLSFYSGVSWILHNVLIPNSSFGSFQTTSLITPEDYRNKRKLEEKTITSWDMAMRFSLQFKKLSISSGVDYFVWGERTDYSNVSYNAQHQNSYRYINIPVLVGYQIQKGSFGIQPFTGLSAGFLAQETMGFYLNIDNSTSAYQANINKFTGSVHAGCELAYFSQSGIKVSINPIVRTALTKVVQSDLARNRYSSLGLQLGIGYRW